MLNDFGFLFLPSKGNTGQLPLSDCFFFIEHVNEKLQKEKKNSNNSKKLFQGGIHPGFETQGRHCQKSITGVSVASQKGLRSSKKLF